MILPTFLSWNTQHTRVFLRADLNIPLLHGTITNDFRLQSIIPTLDALLQQNASVVLATHIGRPTHKDPELSTKIIVPWFRERGYSINYIEDFTTIAHLKIVPRQILLIENLRFFPEEKKGDSLFAKQLATTASYYINDAFGALQDNDTSISLLPYEFPENRRSIGLLIEKELRALSKLNNNPARPFIAILGGGKIEEKIPLIQHLLPKIDMLLLCPALCFSFLKASGKPIGKSLINDAMITPCKQIILHAQNANIPCLFPVDYQVASDSIDGNLSLIADSDFPDNAIGISIGPKTVSLFIQKINQARTIFFNCAMGFDDNPETQKSTKELINAMAQSSATTVIAGGDSVSIALQTEHHQRIDHLSTGGGAALAYLSNLLLPGLTPFTEQ